MGGELHGLHSLTPATRLDALETAGWIDAADRQVLAAAGEAATRFAHRVTENSVTAVPLPVGVVTNVLINGTERLVPLATEEPSVVAACCKAANLASAGEGLTARAGERRVGAQVLLETWCSDEVILAALSAHRDSFIAEAAAAHPAVARAGGGLLDIGFLRHPGLPGFVVFRLRCDPADAMGANLADALAEQFVHAFGAHVPGTWIAAIVSNHPAGGPATAEVRIPVAALANRSADGAETARRIALMSRWAEADPERCATHNKGVLNGVLGVLSAVFQDTRAAAAAVSAYTCRAGAARPLATWRVEDEVLCGEFAGPVPCGTAGGTGPHAATTKLFYRWMKVERAAHLEEVAAGIGLLQNLGALLSLVTEGIQKGHMRLHERKKAQPRN